MNILRLVDSYLTVKEELIRSGFAYEIDWQNSLCFSKLNETAFLREAAWVILSAGMKEAVVRKKFEAITAAFKNWESAAAIVKNKRKCQLTALRSFNHVRKISAISGVAEKVYSEGFADIRSSIFQNGIDYLEKFPFIGPVTRYHLAKNLGLDVVKPDRHLVRIAQSTNFSSAHEMCHAVSKKTGDKIAVVDLVMWRFATIEPRYVDVFRNVSSNSSKK